MNESWREYRDFFKPGVSYCEKSIGSNALTVVNALRKPIYIYPRFHYCHKLKKWHEYCIPIKINSYITGYLLIVSIRYPIPTALEGFLDLIRINLEYLCFSEISNTFEYNALNNLTTKQNTILKMIGQGLSDELIAQELGVTLATVKYHNQMIFKKLNANSRVDAVVKGLISNEITISDLLV